MRAGSGSVSVERFMQEALYHPPVRLLCPASARHREGRRFFDLADPASGARTSHRRLGERALERKVSRRGTWHLIELGGGNGKLAAGDIAIHRLVAGAGVALSHCRDFRRIARGATRAAGHGKARGAMARGHPFRVGGGWRRRADFFQRIRGCVSMRAVDARTTGRGVAGSASLLAGNAEHPDEVLADWHGPLPPPRQTVGLR